MFGALSELPAPGRLAREQLRSDPPGAALADTDAADDAAGRGLIRAAAIGLAFWVVLAAVAWAVLL